MNFSLYHLTKSLVYIGVRCSLGNNVPYQLTCIIIKSETVLPILSKNQNFVIPTRNLGEKI